MWYFCLGSNAPCGRVRTPTHDKSNYDETKSSGKFDQKLACMSRVVDSIGANALMRFNEPFTSINEREGAEIGRKFVTGLLGWHVKVAFVIHQYEFARGSKDRGLPSRPFIRAMREPAGLRTFKLKNGKQLRTNFRDDLYRQIFVQGQHRGAVEAIPEEGRDPLAPAGGPGNVTERLWRHK